MIGENIKKLRASKGWTQKELAEKLFVTAQAVSRWENNEVEPSATTLYEMSKIFEVSIDELFGKSAPAPIVEKELVVEKEYVYSEPKQIIAVCSQCNKAIYKESDIMRGAGNNPNAAICKKCYDKNIAQRKAIAEANHKAEVSYGVKQRKKAFVWGGILAGLVLALTMWLLSSVNVKPSAYAIGVLFAISIFTFVSCLFLKNNFVGEMVVEIISWGFVKFPGVIFGLSIDGCLFFMAVKLLFWLLGILLACTVTALAFILGTIVSIFVYPFAIMKSFKHPEKSEKYF
ncbi:MAG: helix-turn-helix transcriptional regulator [Clostridia bacterium]|nr:helix-turn-helix transcriptional regulator [Clostridia bacterium]